MTCVNWRGEPVTPATWIEGYRAIYPIMREPSIVRGAVQRQWLAQFIAEFEKRTEEGAPR